MRNIEYKYNELDYPYYVVADIYSESFENFDEAYKYALRIYEKCAQNANPDDLWCQDPIILMDNIKWEKLVEVNEHGIFYKINNHIYILNYDSKINIRIMER